MPRGCHPGGEWPGLIIHVGKEVFSGSGRQRISLRTSWLGEVRTDVDKVIGDHGESDPASDPAGSSVERSPQPMPAFENTDAAFTAGAPFLELLEPTLFLPLLASGTLGVMARNRYSVDTHFVGLGFVSG